MGKQTFAIITVLGLLLAPSPVLAEDEIPYPEGIVCPAPIYVDGIPRIPDYAPADCVYLSAEPMPAVGDPCAPDPSGVIPDACLSDPVDGCVAPLPGESSPNDCPSLGAPESCFISSDGATNCPDVMPGPPDGSTGFTFGSITLADGTGYAVAGQLTLFADRLGVSVGCNSIGGAATYGADSAIAVDELFSTEMYCEGVMDAEAALIAILLGDGLVLADNTLVSAAGRIALADRVETNGGVALPGSGIGIAIVALFFPLAIGALGIALGLNARRGERS